MRREEAANKNESESALVLSPVESIFFYKKRNGTTDEDRPSPRKNQEFFLAFLGGGGLPRKVSPTNTTTMFSLFPCRFFCFFFNEMGGCNFCCGQLIMISSSPPKFFFWLSIPLLLVGHQWLLLLILPLFLKFSLSLGTHPTNASSLQCRLSSIVLYSLCVCVCWCGRETLSFVFFLSTFLLSHLRLLAPSCSSFFRLESEHLNRA